jgi:hypothetical protein
VPTFDRTETFIRDHRRLSPAQARAFKAAVVKFVEDLERLPPGRFRASLRVKPMQGAPGIFEMTWEGGDGRATFQYGEALRPGEPHIIWRRVGGHAIFDEP